MNLRARHSLYAVLSLIPLFPILLFLIGIPLGLIVSNFVDATQTLFMLSWIPPVLAVPAAAALIDRWSMARYEQPVLALYLIVAGVSALMALFLWSDQTFYGLIWSGAVAVSALLHHSERKDPFEQSRLVP